MADTKPDEMRPAIVCWVSPVDGWMREAADWPADLPKLDRLVRWSDMGPRIAGLQAALSLFRQQAREVGEAMAELQAKLEAVEQDAERYRWLRDTPWPPELEADIRLHRNARWDTAIDAVRKGEGRHG